MIRFLAFLFGVAALLEGKVLTGLFLLYVAFAWPE